MTQRIALAALVLVATHAPLPAHAAGDPAIRSQTVQFTKGATSAQLRGSIKGDAGVDYKISARAGQILTVTIKTSNASSYFNINPPGSEAAMFIGSTKGPEAMAMLPTDGTYVVRVYLMRNAARRNETAQYTLTVAVTGQPLAPLPGSQDAKIRGTAFHASAPVACQPPGTEPGGACQAFVIRRGRDGTGTVEVRGANGLARRVLFVRGAPVASDSSEALASSRRGELTTVRVGADEQFEIPDALLTGG